MTLNVYILTYNRSGYLKESIDSVLNQTYTDFNLYIIDNCSTDNTEKIVNEYKDNRVHYYKQPTNVGSFKNFAYAINHCKADYFVLFHDDDIMLPNMIEKEIQILNNNPKITAVSGNSIIFNDKNRIEKLFNTCQKSSEYTNADIINNFLLSFKTLIYPSIMYRNSFVKEKNILPDKDAGPCADIILYSDIALAGGIIYEMCDVVMKTRSHSGQDSFINGISMRLQLYYYLKSNEKYKEIFHNNANGRLNSYKIVLKIILKTLVLNNISIIETKKYLKEFKDVLMINNEKNIWFYLIIAFCHFPKFFGPIFSKVFQIYFSLKDKKTTYLVCI